MTIPRSEAVVHEEVAGSPSGLSNTDLQTSVSHINVPALNGVTEEHDDPHRLARIQLANGATRAGVWTLRYWQGSFWQWKAGCYRAVGDDDLRVALTGTIKVEFDRLARLHGGKSKRVAAGTIGNVVMALKSLASVVEVEAFPAWLGPSGAGSNYFAFENGLLNSAIGTVGGLEPATPEWFSPVKFPFNYDEDATCPQWRAFVASVFAPDPRGADLLQEIMGLSLIRFGGQFNYAA